MIRSKPFALHCGKQLICYRQDIRLIPMRVCDVIVFYRKHIPYGYARYILIEQSRCHFVHLVIVIVHITVLLCYKIVLIGDNRVVHGRIGILKVHFIQSIKMAYTVGYRLFVQGFVNTRKCAVGEVIAVVVLLKQHIFLEHRLQRTERVSYRKLIEGITL